MTTIEEHVDTVRDFVMEQEEPSDFALDALSRIEKEAAQKDTVIKALADALWDARQYGDDQKDLCWCQAPCAGMEPDRRNPKCEAKVETLRLAGRLP